MSTEKEQIVALLKSKSCLKQEIFRNTQSLFDQFKQTIQQVAEELKEELKDSDQDIEISYKEMSRYEVHLKFAGDILVFSMHTNVFNFDAEHAVAKSPYVKEDPNRGYCGMIQIYNFLSDTFKYQRLNDIGYMIGRVFINNEGNFFVEGERQLGFLFTDFKSLRIDEMYIRKIVESSIQYSIDFDLWVPQYGQVREMSLLQKLQQAGNMMHKTGKRIGFQ